MRGSKVKTKRLLRSDRLPHQPIEAVQAASSAAVDGERLIISQLKLPYILVVDDYDLAAP